MKRLTPWLGWLVLAVCVARYVSTCGTRTEVGPWGLPRERIDAAGRYPDGAVADPLNRALVTNGWDQPVLAGVILVHVGLFAWLAWSIRRHRHRVARPKTADRGPPRRRARGPRWT